MRSGTKRHSRPIALDNAIGVSVHRFVLFTLLVGILASGIRFLVTLRYGSLDFLRFDGTLVGVGITSSLAIILWRRPKSLRAVMTTIYVYVTAGITIKLIYLLFWNGGVLYSQLLWMVPWMSISFVLSFLLFSRKRASALSLAAVGVWVIISGVFLEMYAGTEQGKEALLMLSQTFFAQCVLIVFLGLYSRIQGLYLVSRKSALRMERMAHTDFLLGTANRRSIHDELSKEVCQATETGTPLSVILMDVDQFKQINDRYGHDIGDAVLVEVTSAVLDVVKSARLFGRWGGDEFLVISPNADAMESHRIAQEIRCALETYSFDIGQVTASFGVAEFTAGDDIDSLLKRADEALYKSKQLGRNRVEVEA